MIKNVFTIAFRYLIRNKRYFLLNALGLGVSLFSFLIVQTMAKHERNYDTFFENSENIYGVYTYVKPEAGFGVGKVNGVAPILQPFIQSNIEGVTSSRYVNNRQTVSREDKSFFESVKFVDPGFQDIFKFEYISGGPEEAFNGTGGLIITEEAAQKYFGDENPVGQTLLLGNRVEASIAAVIKDLPQNSHFVYRFGTGERLQIIAPFASLEAINSDYSILNWSAISDRSRIYMSLDPGVLPESVSAQMTSLIAPHADERGREIIAGFDLLPLVEWNYSALDADSLNLITIAVYFAGLILFVGALNYSNIFSVMILGRLRELAVRKTLGANKLHISLQLFAESFVITGISAIVALVAVEAALPFMSGVLQKNIALEFLGAAGMSLNVLAIVFVVSLFSIIYPLSVITRAPLASVIRGISGMARGGTKIRSFMVILQFVTTGFLVILMAVSYFQNQHMLKMDLGFDGENVITIKNIDKLNLGDRLEVFEDRLTNLANVESVAGSSQHPFESIHIQGKFAKSDQGTAEAVDLYQFDIGPSFFETYKVETLAGRGFDKAISGDTYEPASEIEGSNQLTNIIINRSAMIRMGYQSPEASLGAIIYTSGENVTRRPLQIVGVTEDANFLGLTNDTKPIVFRHNPSGFRGLSIRYPEGSDASALLEVNSIWGEMFQGTPIVSGFLSEEFAAKFAPFAAMGYALISLSLLALSIASFGLVGLVSLFAEKRKKEIGIRKVLGASTPQIMKTLSWQFIKPVMVSLAIALPLGGLAAGQYLNLFSERIDNLGLILGLVTIVILGLSWLTVSGQAFTSARQSPVHSLRSE